MSNADKLHRMEKRSAALGAAGMLFVGGLAFGGISLANAQNAPAPATSTVTATTEAPAPAQEPVVTEAAPEPTTEAPAPVAAEPAPVVADPAPVVAEPAPVYVEPAPEPVAPAPVVVAPAPVAPAPAQAGEYNQVQLQPVNGTSATAYSTDPNAPVNAPTAMPGNGKRG